MFHGYCGTAERSNYESRNLDWVMGHYRSLASSSFVSGEPYYLLVLGIALDGMR